MGFTQEMVSSFKSSMTFLIDSMMETVSYSSGGSIMSGKPAYHVQTEKFSSFYDKVKENEDMVDNFRKKVVVPVFNSHSMSFLSNLVGADGKVQDEFLKVSRVDDSDFKIRVNPDGIYLQVSKVFLPVSEVYTEAVRLSIEKKSDNLPFPNKILLGLYSIVFHAIRDEVPKDQLDMIQENRKVLSDSLESCDEAPTERRDAGPMGMIKNILGNIDFNQIGDMMQKVSGDENSSKEFGEVFGKISDTIKSGGNPLEPMGDIIKQVSMNIAEEEGEKSETGEVTGQTVESGEGVQTEETGGDEVVDVVEQE